MDLVGMTRAWDSAMVVVCGGEEVVLEVRLLKTRSAADKSTSLNVGGGSPSCLLEYPLKSDSDHIVWVFPLS